MKKFILLVIVFICTLQFSYSATTPWCSYSQWWNISDSIDNCLKWWSKQATLVSTEKTNLKISDWLKDQINDWTMNVATFLSIFAVWAIVFWAFKMVVSWWEEENINKGKDIVKWSMLWFALVVSASAFVRLIVEVMYSLSWQ